MNSMPPTGNCNVTHLIRYICRPVLPDEMQQPIFTVLQYYRAFSGVRVDKVRACATECATCFECEAYFRHVGDEPRTRGDSRSRDARTSWYLAGRVTVSISAWTRLCCSLQLLVGRVDASAVSRKPRPGGIKACRNSVTTPDTFLDLRLYR